MVILGLCADWYYFIYYFYLKGITISEYNNILLIYYWALIEMSYPNLQYKSRKRDRLNQSFTRDKQNLDWQRDQAQSKWDEGKLEYKAYWLFMQQHYSESRRGAASVMEKRAHSDRVEVFLILCLILIHETKLFM